MLGDLLESFGDALAYGLTWIGEQFGDVLGVEFESVSVKSIMLVAALIILYLVIRSLLRGWTR